MPFLSDNPHLGYVIFLRDVRAVRAADVFRSTLDARLANASGPHFVRYARFSDALRFAIAQRLALLWSRIGLNEQYEDDVDAAIELVADGIVS